LIVFIKVNTRHMFLASLRRRKKREKRYRWTGGK